MVLGLGSKKKGATVKVEFQIQVQEIKPWRAEATASGAYIPLLVQWQRGENRSGRLRSAVPRQEDGGRIVFNDTFRLPAKLVREPATGKGRNAAGPAKFQKKTIVFVLQEATTDVQLARCVMDLAEYGGLQSSVSLSIPLAVGKKNASGGPTPSLFLTIGPLGKEERSFSSRVSFGVATPRASVSKAPDKAVSVSGKLNAEPTTLDEDTRRSIVAALMSDDDDNASIESFTDDESTPEESTPRSAGRVSAAPTTPEPEMSRSSPTGPKSSEAPPTPPTNAVQESLPKSVNKSIHSSSSSSSTPQAVGRTHTEDPTNNTSHDRPSRSKDDPGKATQSSALVGIDETVESSRHVLAKQFTGRVPKSSPISVAGQTPSSSTVAPSSTASITQLFSTDPVYKSGKVADHVASESATRPAKILPSTSGSPLETESQSSKVTKQPPLPEQGDKATPVTSATDVTNKGGSNSSTRKANKISVSSSEHSHIVGTKSTGRTSSSGSWAESKKLGESAGTERPHSPVPDASASKELSQESTSLLPLAPAKAAAAAAASAASAYIASRTFRSFESSSFDYLSENSEDSFSESSNSGRSPAQTALRDQLHVSGNSMLSSEHSMDAKRGENKELDGNIRSNISVERDERRDDSKASHSNSPDVKKNIVGEPERKKETADKLEESVEQGESVLGSARANLAKMERRALEELRMKITNLEAKLLAETQKVENLQGELRDVGAMEVSLYCVVAEHGSSSHKLHTPARRLARLYKHAHKNWSPERRAGTVKNSVSGLMTVARSCGSDVSRLTFWWSNVVSLRAIITQAFDKGLSNGSKGDKSLSSPNANGNGSPGWARAKRSSFARRPSLQTPPSTPKAQSADWQEVSTYIAALEKIEEWIYSKIVESLWWQAMIPRMQKDVDASLPTSPKGMAMLFPSALFGSVKEDPSKLAGDATGTFVKKLSRRLSSLPELGDARQGNMSVEVWKKAILEALRRLCPVRGAGHDCGCLPMLIKMAIEGCVARLDVALFNAMLREPGDDVPTDPISDPVSDSSVLPISPGGLTFGGGSQLKNVVVTWSTFIAGLVTVKEPAFLPDAENGDHTDTSEDAEKVPRFFNLIKATGDLLMLPKDILMDRNIRKEEARPEAEKSADLFVVLRTTGDILQLPKDLLMDKSVRREICPMLSLQLIRRILVNFVPDEFSPDPISASLLAALNAEASIEKQRQGEADSISSSIAMAAAPPIVYVAPSAEFVWSWIGEASVDTSGWGRSNSSLLRKGYTSDEDLTVMEELQKSSASSKLELFLTGSSMQGTANGKHSEAVAPNRSRSAAEISGGSRFELLKEFWGTP